MISDPSEDAGVYLHPTLVAHLSRAASMIAALSPEQQAIMASMARVIAQSRQGRLPVHILGEPREPLFVEDALLVYAINTAWWGNPQAIGVFYRKTKA